VIAKILGTVNREKRHGDSFVVTEDDYLGYLSDDDIGQLIPVDMAERLRQTHFLFLGCSLQEWNLRSVLNSLFRDDRWGWNSFAILPSPESIEERSWSRRGVEPFAARLEEYIDRLGAALISASTKPLDFAALERWTRVGYERGDEVPQGRAVNPMSGEGP
jgi:hypothetical protein